MVDAFNLTVLRGLPLVITATNLISSANLLTLQPGEKAVGPGGANPTVTVDLGAGAVFRQVALLYTDLSSSGHTWKLEASNNADLSAPVLNTTTTAMASAQALERPAGYRHLFYHHAAGDVAARYLRITIITTGAFSFGRLMAGPVIQLENNPDYGETSWGYDEADEPELLDSGVEVLYEDVPAPVLNFTATWVSQAEMDADWEPLGRLQHEGTPVLVARRPDVHATRHSGLYYGRLRMIPIVAQDFDLYEVQGRVRSMV